MGVFGFDNILYVILLCFISMELICKFKLDFVLIVFLDVKVFNINWKLGVDFGVFWFKLIVNLKSWILLMVILLFNKGRRLNFVDKWVIFSIFWFFWLCKRIFFIMIWFSKFILICFIEIFVFSMFFNFLVIKIDNLF